MIYTVTLNPSLDYIVSVKDFQLGMTNRTESEAMFPGGKGINVSIVLKNLGIESCTLGYIAGFVGNEIQKRLIDMGINAQFTELEEGNSRINVKLTSIDGTEINGQGPEISKSKFDDLLERLMKIQEGDILVLAGSIPSTMPSNIYQIIMKMLADKGVTVVVDATNQLLLNVLAYHPFLIKPNHHELGEIFGDEITSWKEAIPYARRLQEMGARNVLVSMGGKGGILVSEEGKVYGAKAYQGNVKNTVGAGDSTVAGFITGYLQEHSYEYAFKLGMATGGASACSDLLATKQEVEKVLKEIHVEELSA